VSAAAASRSGRRRLDVRLVEAGLVESREKARALVMAGRVRVDGKPARKAGEAVGPGVRLEVDQQHRFVGRGALKLAGALDHFGIDPRGRVALDVGASTGGFTELLLERGARRVYAVDVGYGQLHQRLREDPRVAVRERVNARHLSPSQLGEACELAVIDVSFISALKLLEALRGVLVAEADVACLVKPQFEVGRRDVGRGGVVRDPGLHRRALASVAAGAAERGWAVLDACASPLEGAEGNREFFLHLRPAGRGLDAGALGERLDAAVATP
jgi:23S rRNA (cytidine1920-2'-O)/16S rRNA (cytidine1409-2'-O)-methyltransferase